MSALLGEQLAEDYIKVGEWYLPLPEAPSDETEWGILHFTPLEPFSASTVLGDDSLVSDDRIASMIWSNMQAGIGKHRYQEGQSMSGVADGDLDLSSGHATTLPPQKVALAALDAPFASAPPIYFEGIDPSGANTWVAWNRSANGLRYYNGAAWSTPAPAGGLSTATVRGFERFAGVYVVATSAGIFTSPDGNTWTQRWTATTLHGLAVHDEKLYTYNTADGKVYWTTTPAAAGAWPSSSAVSMALQPGEYISQLLEWVDKTGENCVVLITDRRIMFYDDADYFTQFWPKRSAGGMKKGGWPTAHVWARDDRMYLTAYPWSDNIISFDHQTVDDVGANKEGGIGNPQRFAVSHLAGSTRHLFAICPPRSGETKAGRVMKGTEAFGWSTINRGKLADPEDYSSAVTARVTGGGWSDDWLVTCFHTGAVERQWVPDRSDLPQNVTDTSYDQGWWWMFSGEADASLEYIDKLAKWWRIDMERAGGRPGLEVGGSIKFKYRWDSGDWIYAPIDQPDEGVLSGLLTLWGQKPSAQQWPAVFPLPSRDNQQGTPFLKVEWALGMLRGVATTTPLLRSVSLHYLRLPDIYDGIQVPIDLSRERFDQMEDQKFHGLDRESLWWAIQQLKGGPGQPKRTWPVEISRGGTVLSYPAMDVRVSGNVDPQSNLGRIDLTLRDTSAPPSGLRATSA